MKIKQIQLKQFRTYRDWKFTPKEKGLHLIYGPNESGKTTLLEGMRGLLFGWNIKDRKESKGALQIIKGDSNYHLEREGKKLEFYKLGEASLEQEPKDLWWHGLDRKTYERIFAITLEDMCGTDIVDEVDVRTRFFGADGGERLSETVKNIEKTASELLVASANGKRKINTLLKELSDLDKAIKELGENEHKYVEMRKKIEATLITEKELQTELNQWKDYYKSVELVLSAWDTYKRMEEAQSNMSQLMQGSLPDQEKFMEIDQELKQCREHMRIWRGKEEGLLPENFSPDAAVGKHSIAIESLYEQLGQWEQLIKDCEQGKAFLQRMFEQLQIAKKMHTTWLSDVEMPTDVDWNLGEKLTNEVRQNEHAYEQWKNREPSALEEEILLSAEDESNLAITQDEINTQEAQIIAIEKAMNDHDEHLTNFKKMDTGNLKTGVMLVFCLIFGLLSQYTYFFAANNLSDGNIRMAIAIGLGIMAVILLFLSYRRRKRIKIITQIQHNQLVEIQNKLVQLCGEANIENPINKEKLIEIKTDFDKKKQAFYNRDIAKVKQFTYLQNLKQYKAEGEKLEQALISAQAKWTQWLPKGVNVTCMPNNFFGIKQEYDTYMEQENTYKGYVKQYKKHEAALENIKKQASELWKILEIDEQPTPVGLRQLHRSLQNHEQNKVRWEQKESQRRNYREEFDKWHSKEKSLLVQQDEILQKSAFTSAVEFRRKMLSIEQYRQWETIVKQSKIQLKLLAPKQDVYDLLTRRLKEGDKSKWEEENTRSQKEMERLERQLAQVYEERGIFIETMRQIGEDDALAKALQKRSQKEDEMRNLLEEWATQVYIGHFIERAQQKYEAEKQPQVLDIASNYVSMLTNNRYTLADNGENGAIVLHDKNGQVLTHDTWSSGLADQVYLSLRLSLASRFGSQVDKLPIILDDIFVRFDEKRQQEALRVLAELSETEQIFIFTCQEQLMRLAKEINDERIEMYSFSTERQIESY